MTRWAIGLAALLVQVLTVVGVAAQSLPLGHWRLIEARQAPWLDGPPLPMPFERSGLIISDSALRGPDPLACAPLRIEKLDMPLPGLFEGGLPKEKALAIAASLGLRANPAGVPTFRLTCPNASFDLHGLAEDRFLFLLDGIVYTARRVAGVPADRAARFLMPAWPALDCTAPALAWQRLTCSHPETSAAHAAMAQMLRVVSKSAGDGGKAFAAAQGRFLSYIGPSCKIVPGKASDAESAQRAECLRQAFEERAGALSTGLH